MWALALAIAAALALITAVVIAGTITWGLLQSWPGSLAFLGIFAVCSVAMGIGVVWETLNYAAKRL